MEIIGFPSGPLETNCYVATGPSMDGDAADGPTPVVIIDPGMDALGRLKKECEERNLKPEAVLLTHGHIDHTRDVGDVAVAQGDDGDSAVDVVHRHQAGGVVLATLGVR